MYQKNQNFINFYKELENSQKISAKSTFSHINANVLDPVSLDTLNKLYEQDEKTNSPYSFNMPATSSALTEFKNLLISVQLSHKHIPSVHLQQKVFDERKLSNLVDHKTSEANHNEEHKKRTAGYTPTVLLTNPLLRPF